MQSLSTTGIVSSTLTDLVEILCTAGFEVVSY
jgi:hypothetical protein